MTASAIAVFIVLLVVVLGSRAAKQKQHERD